MNPFAAARKSSSTMSERSIRPSATRKRNIRKNPIGADSEATGKAPGIHAIDDSDDEDDFPPSKKLRKDQEILDRREEVHELEGVILARDREILRLKQTNHDLELCQAANMKGKSELRVSELEAQINAFKKKVAELKGRWDELKDLEESRDDDVFTEPRTSYKEYEMRDLVDSSLYTLIDIIGGLEKPKGVGVDRRDKDVISMDEDSGDDM